MDYREKMLQCREYIDTHPPQEINPQELAERFGYSFYHFCHVFSNVNGVGICVYLRERRLSRAAAELLTGRSVAEVAAECGFETPAGFTKAFTRRYGVSPSEYKRRKSAVLHITPAFRTMEGFSAIGYVIKPESKADQEKNGALWLGRDFSAVSKEDYARLTYPGYAEIGAWMYPDTNGEMCYFFGPQVKSKEFIPFGMVAIDIPTAEYAVFPVPAAKNSQGLHENINQVWNYIFNDWFDNSGYVFDQGKLDFEFYCGKDTCIYVPVIKK